MAHADPLPDRIYELQMSSSVTGWGCPGPSARDDREYGAVPIETTPAETAVPMSGIFAPKGGAGPRWIGSPNYLGSSGVTVIGLCNRPRSQLRFSM